MMDKDRSDGVISSRNLTTEVPEGRIKKKQAQPKGVMTTSSSYVRFQSNYDAIVANAIDKMNKLRIPCYSHNSAARDPNSSSYHLMTQCNKPKPADLKQALRQVLPGRYEESQFDRMAQIMMDRARMLKGSRLRTDNRDNRETTSDRLPSSSSSSMRNPRAIHLTQSSQEYTSNPPMYIPIPSATSYNPPPERFAVIVLKVLLKLMYMEL
jgi:hypothetical protein